MPHDLPSPPPSPTRKSESSIPSLSLLPGSLPSPPPPSFSPPSPLALARSFLPTLTTLLSSPKQTPSLVSAHFHPDSFWRDLLALSHTFRTLHLPAHICPSLSLLLARASPVPASFTLLEPSAQLVTLPNGAPFVTLTLTFHIAHPAPAQCSAMIKLLPPGVGSVPPSSPTPQIWILTTFFDHFLSLPPLDLSKPLSAPLPVPSPALPPATDVLIIGSSQSGLSLSARLQALSIPHIAIDSHPRVGDSWRTRYAACKLHTSPAFSGLPFADFPSDEPLQIPGWMIADFYVAYVEKFALPVYPGRRAERATWDADADAWAVVLALADGSTELLHARHLVFAIGLGSQRPLLPPIPHPSLFPGPTLHSSTYTTGTPFRSLRTIIIGCANTGMDLAVDLVESGAGEVTLVQRGRTRVYTLQDIHAIKRPLWDRRNTTDVADTIASSDPIAIQDRFSYAFLESRKHLSAEMFRKLGETPFRYVDSGSHFQQVYTAFGGHYIDVGGIQKIIDGEIKVKSGVEISSFTEKGLAFADGSELSADVIIYATGFEKSWREPIAGILGEEVADQIQTDVWGVNAEGEIRGLWKPSGHPRVWLTGGDMFVPRYFSKFLASQIVADLKGVKLEPYTE